MVQRFFLVEKLWRVILKDVSALFQVPRNLHKVTISAFLSLLYVTGCGHKELEPMAHHLLMSFNIIF